VSAGLLEHALLLTENGLSVIPVEGNGSKIPAIPSWKPYQNKIAEPARLESWINREFGLAVVAGEVSGSLEILDFDSPGSFEFWMADIKGQDGDELLNKLPLVRTPSGGFHVYYRCRNHIEGNQKLAQGINSDRKPFALIETRGEGGYALLPIFNQSYELLQGDLSKIPTISDEERYFLLNTARALNEYVKPHRIITGSSSTDGNRPGDDFNRSANWADILEPHGWETTGQRGKITQWRRPGKERGTSATTNFDGSDLFYNFSTNAHPFEAETAYGKFAAYAFLNHAGDFSAAASDLASQGYGEKENQTPLFASFASFAPRGWPDPLAEDAYYGLVGEITQKIEPHTEADSAALLTQFLVAFGNVVDRSAHFLVEATPHYTTLFAVLVGDTAKSRKGTSWGHIPRIYEPLDTDWIKERIQNGLSSGEGLIWAVRDPLGKDNGVVDKRLLVVESEFASTLKVISREGNTLSPVIRNAWDTGDLNILNKNSPAKATDAHISIIGHITNQELLRYLNNTEAGNGFGNRFLWVCVRRSKLLPEGGCIENEDFEPLKARLEQAINTASGTERIKFNEDARKLWYQVYPELSEGKLGLFGAMIARAEAQVIRLACIYALLDCSAKIQEAHLRAALAVWDYCAASCRYIFGDTLGDPDADDLLKALRESSKGMTRTQISNVVFKRHKNAAQIGRVLDLLETRGLIQSVKKETDGRTAEVWFAAEKCERSELCEISHEVEKKAVVLT